MCEGDYPFLMDDENMVEHCFREFDKHVKKGSPIKDSEDLFKMMVKTSRTLITEFREERVLKNELSDFQSKAIRERDEAKTNLDAALDDLKKITTTLVDTKRALDMTRRMNITARSDIFPQNLRPEVRAFALGMEIKLCVHDKEKGETGWKDADIPQLNDELGDEVFKLDGEILCSDKEGTKETFVGVCNAALDVANFAMFIWDKAQEALNNDSKPVQS